MGGLDIANKEKIFQILKQEDEEVLGMFIMTFKKGEKGSLCWQLWRITRKYF